MKDRSLGIFLMAIFGILGTAILMLAWLWPMPASERIMAAFIGSTGLLMALTRALLLRSIRTGADGEHVAVTVGIRDNA